MATTALRPHSAGEAAEALRALAAEGRAVRPRGGGTKLGWGGADPPGAADLDTAGLVRIVEHNTGDFTAVLEAGVRVADARATFAQAGQMLALDPPLGDGDAATIGGVVATADAGPLRHRYGAVRDLVLGATVVLSDGTIASSGGKVIKNVAGYDLAKLFAGSFGTLGLIASVSVRLHPRPEATATALAAGDDPSALARVAHGLAALPLEADCLDVSWNGGGGEVLVRFGGARAADRAREALPHLAALGDARVEEDDDARWAAQRRLQRAPAGGGAAVVKVAAPPSMLGRVLDAAGAQEARVVARAGLGLAWVALDAGRVPTLRAALPGAACTVLDGAGAVEHPWPAADPGALTVMRRVKARFDPAGIFRPGTYVGGI